MDSLLKIAPFHTICNVTFCGFDAHSADRSAVEITNIFGAQRISTVKDVQLKLAEWEEMQRMYVRQHGEEPLNEAVRKARLVAMMPVRLEAYLNDQLLTNPTLDYQALRKLIMLKIKQHLARGAAAVGLVAWLAPLRRDTVGCSRSGLKETKKT